MPPCEMAEDMRQKWKSERWYTKAKQRKDCQAQPLTIHLDAADLPP